MVTAPAPVLAWITPTTPYGAAEREAPAERAAYAALSAVADFYIAIKQATTVGEALTLHRMISEVLAAVEVADRAALQKADSF